jgi:hypothetical protein
MEKALRRIARAPGGMPAGDTWHRGRLLSMTLSTWGVRPAALQRSTANALDA